MNHLGKDVFIVLSVNDYYLAMQFHETAYLSFDAHRSQDHIEIEKILLRHYAKYSSSPHINFSNICTVFLPCL
jgi:hypothetical protein